MPTRIHRHSVSAVAPFLCAIHCVLTPLLVAVVPSLGHHPTVEYTLFGATTLLAIWALRGGWRIHGDPRPALASALGLALWGGALAVGHSEFLVGGAALLTASGLLWNGRRRHLAEDVACPCPSCGHPDD